MKTKQTFIVVLVQLIWVSIVFNTISCIDRGNECFEQERYCRLIMKIGDHEIDSAEFQKKLNDLYSIGLDSISVPVALFDNLISAGLMVETARKLGYENNINIIQHLYLY